MYISRWIMLVVVIVSLGITMIAYTSFIPVLVDIHDIQKELASSMEKQRESVKTTKELVEIGKELAATNEYGYTTLKKGYWMLKEMTRMTDDLNAMGVQGLASLKETLAMAQDSKTQVDILYSYTSQLYQLGVEIKAISNQGLPYLDKTIKDLNYAIGLGEDSIAVESGEKTDKTNPYP